MFHQNIGTQVRSSTKYFVIFGLLLLVVGSGYSVYLYRKAHTPPVAERATSPQTQSQQQRESDCTSASPCTLTVGTGGSTERGHIPQGKSVCFEPYFWNNIQRLGYKTSYKGGPEGGIGVSADTFWFVPEAGINVPRHWFVQEGVTQC